MPLIGGPDEIISKICGVCGRFAAEERGRESLFAICRSMRHLARRRDSSSFCRTPASDYALQQRGTDVITALDLEILGVRSRPGGRFFRRFVAQNGRTYNRRVG